MRLLCLQSSSVFESYGGIEYYLDDLLSLGVGCLGADSVDAVIPQRISSGEPWPTRSYGVHRVPFLTGRLPEKMTRPLRNRYSPAFFRAAFSQIKRKKPTVLLCAHVSLGPMSYVLSRLTGIPYLTVCYGLECWGDLWKQDEWALRQADGIISISEWTKRVLVERGYSRDKIQVVPPMLPAAYESIVPPERVISPNRPLRLLTISRLDASEKYKGHDHVLEALHQIRLSNKNLPFQYRICGDGGDRVRLESIARDRALLDCVAFTGRVTDREAFAAAYRDTDVYVMPSRYGKWGGRWRGEGFGIVYVEAAAFAVPSLAYDCGGVTDIVRHGESGWLVPPDDIASLARQLSTLARNPSAIVEAGTKARKAAMGRFTRAAVAPTLIEALKRWA